MFNLRWRTVEDEGTSDRRVSVSVSLVRTTSGRLTRLHVNMQKKDNMTEAQHRVLTNNLDQSQLLVYKLFINAGDHFNVYLPSLSPGHFLLI